TDVAVQHQTRNQRSPLLRVRLEVFRSSQTRRICSSNTQRLFRDAEWPDFPETAPALIPSSRPTITLIRPDSRYSDSKLAMSPDQAVKGGRESLKLDVHRMGLLALT